MTRFFIFVFVLGLAGCSHQAVVSQGNTTSVGSGSASYPFELPKRIIDAHVHWDSPKEVQPEPKMLSEFLENHIVGAVVHSSRKDRTQVQISSDSKIKFAVCAAVIPGVTVAEVQKGIEQKRYRCMKIYLSYVPKYANDPFYLPFYRLAEKAKVPVVFHTGDPIDKKAKVKFADPLQIDEIAVDFPRVNFILAHMGNPWVHSAAEVTYKNDNCYVDVSALMLENITSATPEMIDELVVKPIRWLYLYVENPKKILFGTDWPLLKVRPYIHAVQRAIPKEHWDDVFYANAARLFRFED